MDGFNDFHHFFNGGLGGRPPKPAGDTTKLYKVLGVEKTATDAQIRRAYRSLAMKHHPDRGGDEERFKEVQNAYDVLSKNREAYDQTGDENATPVHVPQGKPTIFQVVVPLEQFYTGKSRKFRATRNRLCTSCKGKGGTGVTKCRSCNGQGRSRALRQLGPGMVQQIMVPCQTCEERGKVIPAGGRCGSCKGKCVTSESKIFTVHIDKGMRPGERIVFHGEGDESPDTRAGDIVAVLKKKAHPVFTRSPEGCHLIVKKKISLLEALTGFQFKLTHLDGRELTISSQPDMVYKPGTIQAIRQEGMEIPGAYTRGHLYIEFDIEFPKSVSKAKNIKQVLSKALGQKAKQGISSTVAADSLQDFKAMSLSENSETDSHYTLASVDMEAEKQAYDKLLADNPNPCDEDDENHQPEGVNINGCAQQ